MHSYCTYLTQDFLCICGVFCQCMWLSDSSLFAQGLWACLYSQRCCKTEGAQLLSPPRTLILGSSTYVLTPVCACCFSFLPVHMRTCIGSMNGREGRLASCFHRSAQWISSHLCFVMFVLSGIHWEPQISGELQGSVHRHQDRCVLYSKLFSEFLSYLSMVKSECINYYTEPGFGGYSFYKNHIFPFFCDFCGGFLCSISWPNLHY